MNLKVRGKTGWFQKCNLGTEQKPTGKLREFRLHLRRRRLQPPQCLACNRLKMSSRTSMCMFQFSLKCPDVCIDRITNLSVYRLFPTIVMDKFGHQLTKTGILTFVDQFRHGFYRFYLLLLALAMLVEQFETYRLILFKRLRQRILEFLTGLRHLREFDLPAFSKLYTELSFCSRSQRKTYS